MAHWGALTIRDHELLAHVGGVERERRPGVKTMAGPLAELMPLRLVDLTTPAIEAWAGREAKTRPARVRSALRLLKAFLRWAASEPDLKGKVDPAAASAKKTRELAGKAKPKNDYLQREQLPNWFTHVRQHCPPQGLHRCRAGAHPARPAPFVCITVRVARHTRRNQRPDSGPCAARRA